MAAPPALYHIEALRKLRGDAFVSFPTADLTKRTVERIYSVPRDKVASPDAFNSPETFEYSGTKLVDQHFTGGDAVYVEVYQKWETLPGTALVTRTIGIPDDLFPPKYRRLIRTVDTNQEVGPDYIFPSGLTGDQNFISLAMETLAKLRLRIMEQVILHDVDPLLGGKTDEWGALTVEESVVNEGDPIDTGFLVKYSTTEPLGNGKSIKVTVKYPANLGSIILKDSVIDEKEGILVAVEKKLVAAGTTGGVDIDGTYRDVKSIDVWRSIQIASKLDIDSLPDPVTVRTTRKVALPDSLMAISGAFGKQTSISEGASGGDSPGRSESVHAMCDGSIVVKVRNGFRGAAKADETRTFFNGPPSNLLVPNPTIIRPSIGTAYLIAKGKGLSVSIAGGDSPHASSGAETIVRSHTDRIGPVMTGDLVATLTGDSTSVTGTQFGLVATASAIISYQIDDSTPLSLNTGNLIVDEAVVEKWRFNIYILQVAIVIVP